MKKKTQKLLIAIIVISLLASTGYLFLFKAPNLSLPGNDCVFSVKETTSLQDILTQNSISLKSETTLKISSTLKQLNSIKPGRYRLTNGMSNGEIIREFRSGGIATVKIRIDDVTTLEELAGRLGFNLLHDSAYFMSTFLNDSLLQSMGISPGDATILIRPNTYEFYWDMSGPTFLKKMKSEFDKLWNENRLKQSDEIGMSPSEVTVLASIVKAETANSDEAPRIAGLYLNRLRIEMPLQSDPTTLFGRKKSAQRVYLSDLQADTPYNTYKITGLPPGPINFPETVYIDAVLKAESHGYIFMCAEPGATGKHRFAKSLAEHERNRTDYVNWLQKRGIE